MTTGDRKAEGDGELEGKTYYWRIDAVNDVNPSRPFKGNVWSFTAEPLSIPVEMITVSATCTCQGETGPLKNG